MKKKTIALLILTCALSLSVGFWVGKINERSLWQEKFSEVVQSELDWLKSHLETSYSFLPPEGFRRVSGTVTQKGEGFLVVDAQIPELQYSLFEEEEIKGQEIRINTDETTEIFRFVASESFPDLPQKILLGFDDIEEGDYLFITSKEDIRDKEEVTAKEIQISFGV